MLIKCPRCPVVEELQFDFDMLNRSAFFHSKSPAKTVRSGVSSIELECNMCACEFTYEISFSY